MPDTTNPYEQRVMATLQTWREDDGDPSRLPREVYHAIMDDARHEFAERLARDAGHGSYRDAFACGAIASRGAS